MPRREWTDARITEDDRRLKLEVAGFLVEVTKEDRIQEPRRRDLAWETAGKELARLLREKYDRAMKDQHGMDWAP